jgi:asparagine synthase (glutamine-hydrolysing)
VPISRGIAGTFFTDAAARPGAIVGDVARVDVGWHQQHFAGEEVRLLVAGRRPEGSLATAFAQLTETERVVLAVEGYIVNLDDLTHTVEDHALARGGLLVGLFEQHGQGIVARLNGGFTLIWWDKGGRTATIATCRGGQRNLYWVADGRGTTVASDLHTLGRVTGRAFELDARAIGPASLNGGVPGTATLLKGVSRVLPGSVLTVDARAVAAWPAVHVTQPRTPGVRREAASYADELDALMRQAVGRLARVADTHAVMVGSGVDSSLVAAYAAQAIPRLTAVTQRMPTELDESAAAARIVQALGLPHTIVAYEPHRDLVADVTAFVRIAEEPAYWNQLGPALLQLLTRLPARPGAFLTGAEGDLLFNFRLPGGVSVRQVIADGLFWPVARHTTRRLINRVTRHTYVTGIDFDLLDRTFLRQHLAADCFRDPGWASAYEVCLPPGAEGELAQRHFIDNGWQNVRLVCQLAGAIGSDALFPYMDDDVAVCVLSLPNELKINKMLLRRLLARFLPRDIVPSKKRGYWAHTIKWQHANGSLRDVLDLLTDRRTLERGVYEPQAMRALADTYVRGTATARSHPVIWQLLLLETFCREYIDRR